MAKYTLKVKVQVINEETGAVEDKSTNVVRGLDSADVSDMRDGLIQTSRAWNNHGIEGQGAAQKS